VRANSAGLPLEYSDFLLATATAQWESVRPEDLEHPFNRAWTTPPCEFENEKRIGTGLLNLREEPNSKSITIFVRFTVCKD
jgi:hypothetical protein